MKSMIILALCSLAMFTCGCSILGTESDRVAAYAGKTVKGYCENVTLPEVRAQIRAKVNAAAGPHSIAVTCAVPTYTVAPETPSSAAPQVLP